LFKKDVEETKKFGRRVCDRVIQELNNRGFFTTDEVPNYGISPREVEQIFQDTKADKENDLIAIFAYNREEAQRTKDFLDELLLKA
jgi:Glu-tRNA(Gln) amidotransferase subunit E-like FAD-binding protein